MSFLFNGKSFFLVSSDATVTRSNNEQAPMGFITNGGEFRDGPPPPPSAPPPSRYETFAQLDSQAGNPTSNIFSAPQGSQPTTPPNRIGGGGNEPTGQKGNYQCDVFAFVQKTVNFEQNVTVDVHLTVQGANIPGHVTIHEIGKAEQLNQRHYQEHSGAYPDTPWIEPHLDRRMIYTYLPDKQPDNQPVTFERGYKHYLAGDPIHQEVFVTTVGTFSHDKLQEAAEKLEMPDAPDKLARVTLNDSATITRSLVSRRTDGQVQYIIYRTDANFEPK